MVSLINNKLTKIYFRIKGVEFIREPKKADYGTVAVFKDLYGNLWDLVQFDTDYPMSKQVEY
ncbi:hypothetical protein [Enterococcus sp. AZ163]|uniref:hypothetical protein n=1 Tax=Enterococcus sp. AZ163 TaxID=2774638 RepID=UPI003D2CBEF9